MSSISNVSLGTTPVPTSASAATDYAAEAQALAPAFEPNQYLAANPDVAAYASNNGLDPIAFAAQHYVNDGHREGRALSKPTSATDSVAIGSGRRSTIGLSIDSNSGGLSMVASADAAIETKITASAAAIEDAVSRGLDPLAAREQHIQNLQEAHAHYQTFDSTKALEMLRALTEHGKQFIERLSQSAGATPANADALALVSGLYDGKSTREVWIDVITNQSANQDVRNAEAKLYDQWHVLVTSPDSKETQADFARVSDETAQVYKAHDAKNPRLAQIEQSLKEAGYTGSASGTTPVTPPVTSPTLTSMSPTLGAAIAAYGNAIDDHNKASHDLMTRSLSGMSNGKDVFGLPGMPMEYAQILSNAYLGRNLTSDEKNEYQGMLDSKTGGANDIWSDIVERGVMTQLAPMMSSGATPEALAVARTQIAENASKLMQWSNSGVATAGWDAPAVLTSATAATIPAPSVQVDLAGLGNAIEAYRADIWESDNRNSSMTATIFSGAGTAGKPISLLPGMPMPGAEILSHAYLGRGLTPEERSKYQGMIDADSGNARRGAAAFAVFNDVIQRGIQTQLAPLVAAGANPEQLAAAERQIQESVVALLKWPAAPLSTTPTVPASPMEINGNMFTPPNQGFSPRPAFAINQMGAFEQIKAAATFADSSNAATRTGKAAIDALTAAFQAASTPTDFHALSVFAPFIVGPAEAAQLDQTYNKPSSQAPVKPTTPVTPTTPTTPIAPTTPTPSGSTGLAKAIDAYNAGIGNDPGRLALKARGEDVPELRMELAEIYSHAFVGRGLTAAEKAKYAPSLTPQATDLQMLEAIGDIKGRALNAAGQEWVKQHPNPTNDEINAFMSQFIDNANKLISDGLKAPAPIV